MERHELDHSGAPFKTYRTSLWFVYIAVLGEYLESWAFLLCEATANNESGGDTALYVFGRLRNAICDNAVPQCFETTGTLFTCLRWWWKR
jgi:hypothetical protein